jgi:hypothetical protein
MAATTRHRSSPEAGHSRAGDHPGVILLGTVLRISPGQIVDGSSAAFTSEVGAGKGECVQIETRDTSGGSSDGCGQAHPNPESLRAREYVTRCAFCDEVARALNAMLRPSPLVWRRRTTALTPPGARFDDTNPVDTAPPSASAEPISPSRLHDRTGARHHGTSRSTLDRGPHGAIGQEIRIPAARKPSLAGEAPATDQATGVVKAPLHFGVQTGGRTGEAPIAHAAQSDGRCRSSVTTPRERAWRKNPAHPAMDLDGPPTERAADRRRRSGRCPSSMRGHAERHLLCLGWGTGSQARPVALGAPLSNGEAVQTPAKSLARALSPRGCSPDSDLAPTHLSVRPPASQWEHELSGRWPGLRDRDR